MLVAMYESLQMNAPAYTGVGEKCGVKSASVDARARSRGPPRSHFTFLPLYPVAVVMAMRIPIALMLTEVVVFWTLP